MTTQSDAGKQRAIAYLKRSLQLNPLYDSEKIIRYRAKALGLAKEKRNVAVRSSTSKREKIIQQIDAVRAACWTEPVEPLIARLDKLPLDDQPDLKRTAERLRVILAQRCRLPELAAHKHFDEKFLSCFKKILTLPPRELAVPREQVVASFRNRKLRGRGLKMIKLLEKEVPALCQLEQEWLESLKRQKVNRDVISTRSSEDSAGHLGGNTDSSCLGSIGTWLIAVFVIKLVFGLLRMLASNQ
ncbi:MAG: hypothetical protein AAGD11_01205 [Planctomycetota bacterium]